VLGPTGPTGGVISYGNTNVASYLSGPVVIGNLTITNATVSTSTTSGSAINFGGAGIAGNINVGGQQSNFSGNVLINGTNTSVSSTTGALIIKGGVGVTGNVYSGGTFYGPLSGTATTATNLAAATSILAGSLSITPGLVGKQAVSTQTFTLTGLTTSHKILVTCGTDLSYGVFITASYASAANTVSIQFTNVSGAQTPPALTLHYFAWV